MIIPQAITVDGQLYNKYHFTMVTTGSFTNDGSKYLQAVAITLKPMGIDENGKLVILEVPKTFRTFDITGESINLKQAFYQIEQIIQGLENGGEFKDNNYETKIQELTNG